MELFDLMVEIERFMVSEGLKASETTVKELLEKLYDVGSADL